jgi:hypothetical protein
MFSCSFLFIWIDLSKNKPIDIDRYRYGSIRHFPYSCFHSKIDARINNDNIVEGENIGS